MKDYILDSHKRCIDFGIEKHITYSRKILNDELLQLKLHANEELILAVRPFMEHLYDFVKGSNFFSILTDSEGCILSVIGDEKILGEATNIKMIPGAYMSEEHIGTNAMSLVLTEQRPIQISEKEHYISSYHRWTCSAAPIRNQEGEIVGVLNLTGYCELAHLHTLGMVIAATNAIEELMVTDKYSKHLFKVNNHFARVFDSISTGIITSDLNGNILNYNKTGLGMFGYTKDDFQKLKIWDLVENYDDILIKMKNNEDFIDEDVFIHSKKNKLQYNLSVYPIYITSEIMKELTFVFLDIKRNRKLAGRVLSNQAIYTFDKVIGENKDFKKNIEYSKKIADSRSTILIMGESGTGKEVFAQSIHNASSRKDEPFIAVNCGAIPRNLIESELFGYEAGSFTGAKKGGNPGKFELADGGTIFLDEIGEMPIDMQTKLLRVIEESVITKIGGVKQIPIEVRIIAATNKDLNEEVEKGNFRKDLFYRLNVLPLYLAPLRDRKDDIPLLINYFMKRTSKKLNKKPVEITEGYLNCMINYEWPGNIRELENIVELIINTEALPEKFKEYTENNNFNEYTIENRIEATKVKNDYKDTGYDNNFCLNLKEVEKKHIKRVLDKYNGSVALSAKALDIGRNTLYRKIKEYDL
ncbi:sigma-54-dependent Fis family transcriptional regulator [Clostridium sp. DL1XJH146]